MFTSIHNNIMTVMYEHECINAYVTDERWKKTFIKHSGRQLDWEYLGMHMPLYIHCKHCILQGKVAL